MSVTAQIPRNSSVAAPGATSFPFGFKVLSKFDLQVQVDGVDKVVDVDYTVTGVGQDAGGEVMFLTPLAGSENVMRRRNMPIQRLDDYQQLGDLRTATLNNDQDAPIMMLQQVSDDLERAIKLPPSYAGVSTDLPGPAASQLIGWNAAGTALRNVDPSGPADFTLRADLAEPGGGSRVSFKQTGTDAVLRSLEGKARAYLEVMDFVPPELAAAVSTAAVDATPYFEAAIYEAIRRGRHGISTGAGRFKMESHITISLGGMEAFAIEGAGAGLTQIIAPASGDAFHFILGTDTEAGYGNWWLNVTPSNGVRVANLSLLATGNNVGTGLRIDGGGMEGRPMPPIHLENLEFRALNQLNSQAFAIGLHLRDCGSVWVTNCRFAVGGPTNLIPTGVLIDASGPDNDPSDIFFSHCEFLYGGYGADVGNYVEGVYFTNCAAVACKTAVKWITTSGESGFHWIGGHINTHEWCFDLGGLFDWTISNALLFGGDSANTGGIRLDGGGRFNITGNTIHGRLHTGSAGIRIVSTDALPQHASYIGNNLFIGCDRDIVLMAGSNNVQVGHNGHSLTAVNRVTNVGAGNVIAPRTYATSVVVAIASGSSAFVDIPIPPNTFFAKAHCGIITQADLSTQELVGFYLYDVAESTTTSARFRVVRRDGAAIVAASVRFSVMLSGL